MRIGLFTDTYFPQVSGVSTSIRTLKEGLEKEGHEVIFSQLPTVMSNVLKTLQLFVYQVSLLFLLRIVE